MRHQLSLPDAFNLGDAPTFRFVIDQLDGRRIAVQVPRSEVLKSGDTRVLPNEGMPIPPARNAPAGAPVNTSSRLDIAYDRLEGSVFGLVEEMDASLCLFRYQFGTNMATFQRDCDCGGDVRQASARERAGRPVDDKYQEVLSVASMVKLERVMRVHAILYARARDLFARRAEAVRGATGVRLICDGT